MKVDPNALRRVAPFALPLVVLACGWMFLISPKAQESARAARDLDLLQQRLAQVRVSVAEPAPPPITSDPRAVFDRRVAARDASSQVLEQLARMASAAPVGNLLIETDDRVSLAGGSRPQAADQSQPDPRFGLFDVPLAYSPISMSFDAEFWQVGEFLWRMRDLATTVEIRSMEIAPRALDGEAPLAARRDGVVRVTLTLFAYAQQARAAATAGVER